MENPPIAVRHRLEDLGLILSMVNDVLDPPYSQYHGKCIWECVESKHSYEQFDKHFSESEHRSELFDQLRWMKKVLEDIQNLATGNIDHIYRD